MPRISRISLLPFQFTHFFRMLCGMKARRELKQFVGCLLLKLEKVYIHNSRPQLRPDCPEPFECM